MGKSFETFIGVEVNTEGKQSQRNKEKEENASIEYSLWIEKEQVRSEKR